MVQGFNFKVTEHYSQRLCATSPASFQAVIPGDGHIAG